MINIKDLSYCHPDTGEIIASQTSKVPIMHKDGTVVGLLGISINRNNPEHIKKIIKTCVQLRKATTFSSCKNLLKTLSSRELSCIEFRAKGKTIRRIANILSLSPRTVETHLNNAKLKTSCFTTEQLIQLYWEFMGDKTDLSKFLKL